VSKGLRTPTQQTHYSKLAFCWSDLTTKHTNGWCPACAFAQCYMHEGGEVALLFLALFPCYSTVRCILQPYTALTLA
jgi:hypothetical protein